MDMVKDIQLDLDQAIQKSTRLFLKAATVSDEDPDSVTDVEAYLDALEGDLGVTLTVSLDQVRAHLPRWVEAMKKELNHVETATGAVERISYAEARKKEMTPRPCCMLLGRQQKACAVPCVWQQLQGG